MKQPTKKFVFFLLLLFCTMVYGAERYNVRVLEQGNMYFFMPYKIKGSFKSTLQYDMTLHSFRDSVSINMTLTSHLGRVQLIRFTSENREYSTTQYELFFQERNGSQFDTRLHIDCPVDVYGHIFSSKTPLTIEIIMDDGKHYDFTYRIKKWEKERLYVLEVLKMIDYINSMQ